MPIIRTWEDRRHFATLTLNGFFEHLNSVVPKNGDSKNNDLIIADWAELMESVFEILDLEHLMAVIPTASGQLGTEVPKKMTEVCRERIAILKRESFEEVVGLIRDIKKANAIDHNGQPLPKNMMDMLTHIINDGFRDGLIDEIAKVRLFYILNHEPVTRAQSNTN